ncbi:MAG: phosphomannomutase/phosphoglucomutase [Bacteroidales bacterium]|nr:phosphomannomutase/phosphoglucomutase [Bacteroidales bacterium]
MKKAFKAYDIRGVFGRDFNLDDVYKIGFFLPKLLKSNKVLVGRDIRSSSDVIFQALTNGITDAGADAYDMGLTTTPMVYWATAKYGFNASVQITASHNPKEYNGLKVSRTEALPVGFDTGLNQLREMAETEQVVVNEKKGNIHPFVFLEEYLHFIKSVKPEINEMKIAVDCSNGMASLFVKELLGDQPFYIYDEPDGSFPNHEPNPLEEENVADLKKLVLQKNCDLGIIFDGDADRVMFVDDKGRFIRPDIMIALLGDYFNNKGRTVDVVMDIRSSKRVAQYLEKLGFRTHLWKVGRAFAALKLRELDAVFGGELAGHYYFKDFYFSDSAFLAVMLMLDELAHKHANGISVSQWVDTVNGSWANSGEMNFKIERKAEAMEALKAHFTLNEKPIAFLDFDGYRVEFKDWWFNVRPSNTEPYLRFLAEAESADILENKLEQVKQILAKFGG